MEKLNIYGDKRINKKGNFGCDISSQRLDDLDKKAIRYVLSQKKPINCIDLGCGNGKIGIILSMLGTDVTLIDKIDITKKVNRIAKDFNLDLNCPIR
jgi:2-polyprenyl-3-methyl-5-hydroxy-6-metoxy-1,4-benzoquinol methylase